MKKNLPNDGLDKFLKKSFEGYEENPSNDVWENISKGLTEEPATATKGTTGAIVSIGIKWWVAAASVLLCVGFAQYYYFHNKIEKISQRVDNQEVIVNDILKNKKELNSKITKTPQSENTITTTKENPNSNLSNENKVVQTNKIEPSKDSPIKNLKTQKLPVVNSQSTTSQEVVAEKQVRNFVDELPTQQFDESGNSSNLANQNEEQKFESESSSEKKNEFFEKPFLNKNTSTEQRSEIVIQQLNQIDNFLKVDENYNFKIPNVATFNKIIPISKMKSGVSIMPFASYYQSTESIDFVGKGPIPANIPPHHLQNLNRDFTGNIRQVGLKFAFRLKGNWRIETGIAYRLETLQATQNIITKYKNRQGQASNRPPDFRFFINTGDGLADIEIKAKKRMNEPISNNEEILFDLDIKRKRTNISIPLKLNYQYEMGCWILGGGVGLAVNIPIENELKIEGTINHPKLEIKNEVPRSLKRKSSGIGSDAIASLNFGYKLTENMSFEASPTFMYQLKSNQMVDRFVKDINVTSFGGDVGLRYSF